MISKLHEGLSHLDASRSARYYAPFVIAAAFLKFTLDRVNFQRHQITFVLASPKFLKLGAVANHWQHVLEKCSCPFEGWEAPRTHAQAYEDSTSPRSSIRIEGYPERLICMRRTLSNIAELDDIWGPLPSDRRLKPFRLNGPQLWDHAPRHTNYQKLV